MNSIALLKKENLTLKKSNKEHKRSELIEDLNKQIGEQVKNQLNAYNFFKKRTSL